MKALVILATAEPSVCFFRESGAIYMLKYPFNSDTRVRLKDEVGGTAVGVALSNGLTF